MTPETVVTTATGALELIVVLLLVLLVPALVVGLLVSVLQAATQINEQTLSFIPKLLVTFGVLMLAGPWLTRLVTEYTGALFRAIPYLVG